MDQLGMIDLDSVDGIISGPWANAAHNESKAQMVGWLPDRQPHWLDQI